MDDETSPWTFDGESAPLTTSGPLLTLVDGRSFALTSFGGDLPGIDPQGLFYLDTRLLKKFVLLINGQPIEPLGHDQANSFQATFIGRYHGATRVADAPIIVVRSREVSLGMHETIEVRNFGDTPAKLTMSAQFTTDLAGLFEVKEGRAATGKMIRPTVAGNALTFACDTERPLSVQVTADPLPTHIQGGTFSWTFTVEPGQVWATTVDVNPLLAGKPCRQGLSNQQTSAAEKFDAWQEKIPQVDTNYAPLTLCVQKAMSDLGSLRIFDRRHGEEPVIAAGAPWFMTLFGRDSLLTGWMSLLVDTELATGVLKTLARLQGTKEDLTTEEQPGRILHEVRFSGADSDSFDDGGVYYGTADATPLFVMLLAELNRWSPNRQLVDELLPHADRALDWIEHYGDVDGDGFVEYERSTTTGLENQGWKDSGDGIRYGDGTICRAPIALTEVQAYVYGAYNARADLARFVGKPDEAATWAKKATELKRAFNERFWVEEEGCFAVGLDGNKAPIDSVTSNIGHALWTGIVDDDKAAQTAKHLLSPEMFSGWGLRTLSSANPGYNPTGYHTGSVWPHDTAIAAAGLSRYGFVEESVNLIVALLECGQLSGGRLPELFSGFDRSEIGRPIGYPASCSPQAWAAASPLLALRSILGLHPDCPNQTVAFNPILPAEIHYLRLDSLRICGSQIAIRVDGGQSELIGLPKGTSTTS